MHEISTVGANGAPPAPENLQRQRVLGRVAVSAAVAGVVALHAYGAGRRDDVARLAGLTATRVSASTMEAARG